MVATSLGFKNFRTKQAGLSIAIKQESKKNNEHLAFSNKRLKEVAKAQRFLETQNFNLATTEKIRSLEGRALKNPLLFQSLETGFKVGLNQYQSLFKEHLKNPELFYLFAKGDKFGVGLSYHLSFFSFHLKNPDLHSSKWARLREGRGELWRLKRCKLIKWAFFKEKPEKPINLVCPIRPPSSKLPLPLFTEKELLDSRYLPLPLDCWNYPLIVNPPQPKPNKEIKENNAVIIENTAEFSINNQPINALSCSLNTDDRSFCWQCSLSIFYEDYQKLDLAEKNIIKVKINGYEWVFRLEDVKTVKRFNSFTVELTGRSPTAELGADYASRLSGFVDSQLYARQVIEQLLNFSEFSLTDWLVNEFNLLEANSVELNDKSPLAVISELATANAGFVETLRNGYEFVIKPRYKVKAWEIAETPADLSIPLSHITELSTERQVNSEFNAVRIAGNSEGLLVYRQEQDRSKEAPITQSPLFTHFQQMREKGIEILSDSGKHQKHGVKTWLGTANSTAEDNMPLAELGDIWEIRGEGIKGIIRGISLNLMLDNEALKIEQSLEIDEYIS